MKYLSTYLMLVSLLMGCSKYEAQDIGEGVIIPIGSIITVSLPGAVDLVPNQESTVELLVSNIADRDVDNVYIIANVLADSQLGRAKIKVTSLIIKAKDDSKSFQIDGYVVGNDGKVGIPLGCDKEDLNECGVFEYEYTTQWEVATTNIIDISNIQMMVKKP